LASALASEVVAAGAANYDAVVLMYNSFVNAAVYKQMYTVISPFVTQSETGDDSLMGYEFDGDKVELMGDMYEFMLASQIYYSWMDAAASEQSSRMTAMENASKNANDMIGSLTLKYNRARQARITTELIGTCYFLLWITCVIVTLFSCLYLLVQKLFLEPVLSKTKLQGSFTLAVSSKNIAATFLSFA
jgi:ATP synthase F1 gamma subunit